MDISKIFVSIFIGLLLLSPFIGLYLFITAIFIYKKSRKNFEKMCSRLNGRFVGKSVFLIPELNIRFFKESLNTSFLNVLSQKDYEKLDEEGRESFDASGDVEDLSTSMKHWKFHLFVHAFFVKVPLETPVSFKIFNEGVVDKIAKKMKLSEEYQTGYDFFDSSCYVDCDDREFLKSYLTPDRARVLSQLLKTNFTAAIFTDEELYLVSKNKMLLKSDIDIRGILDDIKVLSFEKGNQIKKDKDFREGVDYEQIIAEGKGEIEAYKTKTNPSILETLFTIICIVGYFSGRIWARKFYFDLSNFDYFFAISTFVLSLVIVGGLKFLTHRRNKGSSSGHSKLLGNFFYLLMISCLGTYGFVKVSNTMFDKSKPTIYEGVVKYRDIRIRSKDFDTYSLGFSFSKENEKRALTYYSATAETYSKCLINDKVQVEIKKGLFGKPWIYSLKCSKV